MTRFNRFPGFLMVLTAMIGTRGAHADWVRTNSGLADSNITPLVLSESVLYAGGYKGIAKSLDSGATWTDVKPTAGGSIIVSSIVALAVGEGRMFAGIQGSGLIRSTDSGKTWNRAPTVPAGSNVAALILDGGRVLVGTGTGFYVSTDTGATFAASNTGLTSLNISALLQDSSDLYAGTLDSGVFVSGDNGGTWTALGATGFYSRKIVALAKNGGSLFAATKSGAALYVTTNKGALWTIVGSATLAGNHAVSSLAVKDGRMYAGTGGNGVYYSLNNGVTWTAANEGLTFQTISCLLPVGSNLLASTTEDGGTFGQGIFKRPLSEMASGPTGVRRVMHGLKVQQGMGPRNGSEALDASGRRIPDVRKTSSLKVFGKG